MITVYTDGGCTGNPGPGGWAAILVPPDKEPIELSGGDKATTNNRMELIAAIKALEYVVRTQSEKEVQIHTDSQYVKNGITTWIHSWKKNGWRTAAKQDVKNKDLWIALDEWVSTLNVRWVWVKGHSGVPLNERCDVLVAAERNRFNDGY
jgi:ribonuclease HI